MRFQGLQTQSRALSTFIALAQATYRKPTPMPYVVAIGGVILYLVVTRLSQVEALLVVAVFALFGAIYAFLKAPSVPAPKSVVLPKKEAIRDARRRLLSRLNYQRASVGLEEVLTPQAIAELEKYAEIWEEMAVKLDGPTWKNQPILRDQALGATFEVMTEIVMTALGGAISEGIALDDAPGHLRDQVNRLKELSHALSQTTKVLESYYRPSEIPAGVPIGNEFPEVERLRELVAPTA